jgi:monoamine oxidase
MKPFDYASRRAVLGGLAGAVSAPFIPSATRAAGTQIDVVIVGAGAAGIGASLKLKELGIGHIVVEAANRVGGRAFTDTTTFRGANGKAVPFDIGCAWIHRYRDEDPFAAWSRKLDFTTQAHDLSVTNLYYGNRPYSSLMVDMLGKDEDLIKKLIRQSVEIDHQDVAASTLIKDWRKPMDAAATYMGPMDMAVDFDQMSAADFHAMAEYDPNYLVLEGYGTLVKTVALENRMDVSLGTRVTAIKTAGSAVELAVTGRKSGTISARYAIVTVSTGVLGSGAIKFPDGLPHELSQAIDDVPMGLLAKIPLQIPGLNHWFDGIGPYDNLLAESDGLDDVYFLAWPWNTDLMVGFVGGKFAWELSRKGQRAAVDFAKQKLAALFGSSVARKVQRGLLTPWGTDPLALGAYSAARPGKHASRATLSTVVDGKLFLAGEALADDGMFATCSGAYDSGRKVAGMIAERLGVHSPVAAP